MVKLVEKEVFILISVLTLAVLLSGAASAASNIYVNDSSGNDSWDGTSPIYINGTIGPKKTIQNGTNTVDENGTVHISEGTYYEHLNIPQSLNLIGNGINSTILDGNFTGRLINITSTYTVTISYMTLQNGQVSNGGAGSTGSSGATGGTGGTGGNGQDGGAILNNGYLTLNYCEITNNHAGNGGTGGTGGVGTNTGGTGGTGGNGGNGGAVYNTQTLTITNSNIYGNYAGNGGNGGLGGASNSVCGNGGAGGVGGSGAAIYNTGTMIITNSIITSNHAGNGGTGGSGASSTYNLAKGGAGGAGGIGGQGGAIYNTGTLNTTNLNTTNNTAGNGGNGGAGGMGGGNYNYQGSYSGNGGAGGQGGHGGAIYNTGTLTNTNYNATSNTAGNGGNGGKGGDHREMFCYSGNGGTGGNGGNGGAIYNTNNLTMSNTPTSFTSNKAGNGGNGGNGGGSYVYYESHAGNGGNGGNGGIGGVVYNTLTLTMSNSSNSLANNLAGIKGIGGTKGLGDYTASNGNNGTNGTNGSLYNYQGNFTSHYSQIVDNQPTLLYNNAGTCDIDYNWWGSNSPNTLIVGTVSYSPWLYMTLDVVQVIRDINPTNLTASLNNAYNGTDITPLNPSTGHIPDGCQVTFTTDLGSVGSKSITITTTDGLAECTLTADEGSGYAHLTSQLDNQILNSTVEMLFLYVNTATGNDTWDGTSPTYINGTIGPLKTITQAINSANNNTFISVADGNYYENLNITKNLHIYGNSPETAIIANSSNVVEVQGAVTNATLSGFTIQGNSSYDGISISGNNTLISDNYITGVKNAILINTPSNNNITGNMLHNNYNGINSTSNSISIHYNSFYNNTLWDVTTSPTVNVDYNWWGSNDGPNPSKVNGTTYSNWLYMTLTTSPSLIVNGSTSNITASLNNAYNGTNITPLNPATGHIPDGCQVTFTTDLGSIGSKTTTKTTLNGLATATLTADEGPGTAHISALLDNQTSNITVGVETIYVNGNSGNDTWDGTSPSYISGTTGPKKTIQNAINTITNGGTIYVANGTYSESQAYAIQKSLTITGDDPQYTILSGNSNHRVISIYGAYVVNLNNLKIQYGFASNDPYFEYNGGGIANYLANLTIYNCIITYNGVGDDYAYGAGIYNNNGNLTIVNCNITSNGYYDYYRTGYGGGIYNYGSLNIYSSNFIENFALYQGSGVYTDSASTIQFNRFLNNYGSDLYAGTTCDARYNWWGQNTGPATGKVEGSATYTPWLVMNLTASPSTIPDTTNSTITADFRYDSAGGFHDPSSGHIPDGLGVLFYTDLGNLGSKSITQYTLNGVATALLLANEGPGIAHLSAALDNQNVTTNVTINFYDLVYNYQTKEYFHTIQAALDDADSQPGDTIYTDNAIFTENIIINRYINLESYYKNSTIQAADSSQPTITVNPLADGTVIQGFIIQGATESNGILLDVADNCQILNNTIIGNIIGVQLKNNAGNLLSSNNITGNTLKGIDLYRSINNTISLNMISGSVEGVYLERTSNGNLLETNQITNNTANGINLNNSHNNQINYNTVSNNQVTGLLATNTEENIISHNNFTDNGWCGVCMGNSTSNNLTHNLITGSQEGLYIFDNSTLNSFAWNTIQLNDYNGLHILNSQENLITSNNVTENGVMGILFDECLINNLTSNHIFNNGWAGICLNGASSNTLTNNNITLNDEGLVLTNSANNNLLNSNLIDDNTYSGLSIYSSTSNNVTSNSASSNGNNGIFMSGSGNNLLNNNTINNNGIIGLLLANTSNYNNITNNTINDNLWTGLCIHGSGLNTATQNNLIGNQNGIYVGANSQNNTVTLNTVTNNTANGIWIDTSTYNSVINNNINNNTVMGLFLTSSSYNTLENNTIQYNGWAGICMDSSNNNTLTLNTIKKNVMGAYLNNCVDNQIYQNNFIGNFPDQAYDNGTNQWNNSTTGNFWTDWETTTPRPIDGGVNIDQYPSLDPF